MPQEVMKQSKIERSRLTLLFGLGAAAGAGACNAYPPGTYSPEVSRSRAPAQPPTHAPQTTPERDPAGSGTGGGDGGGGGH